jgi:hypothetical protein
MLKWLREVLLPRRLQVEKRVYRPAVSEFSEGRYQQVFTAGYVSIEQAHGFTTLGFTEEKYQSIHGLILAYPSSPGFSPENVQVEFNDQGNTVSGSEIAVGVIEGAFVVSIDDESMLASGRISYEASGDAMTDDPDVEGEQDLQRIVVRLSVPGDAIKSVIAEVEKLHESGVRPVGA